MNLRHFSFDTYSKGDYEPIPDAEGGRNGEHCQQTQHKRQVQRGHHLLALLGIVVLVSAVVLWQKTAVQQHHHHPEVIPTVLSLVIPGTDLYVNALDNPVYEEMKKATFVHNLQETNVQQAPQIYLDNYELHGGDPLTVSWSVGSDDRGKAVLKDSDLFVLHCGADSIHRFNNRKQRQEEEALSTDHSFLHIVEAGTLGQVRAAIRLQQKQKQDTDDTTETTDDERVENEWTFADFPIVRQEVCQFLIYQQQQPKKKATSTTFQLLTASDLLHMPHAHSRPTSIHWALSADDPTRMVVNFITGDQQTGTPVIQYQPKTTGMDTATVAHALQKATGTTDTYRAEELCQAPANLTEIGKFRSPGSLHTIVVPNLQPDSLYSYQVGIAGGQGVLWSDTFTIRTPMRPGAHNFSYLVYGDQGCPSTGWTHGGAMTAAMAAREAATIRAVHHFGDLSYARGAAHIWDDWMNMIQPFATSVPLMISVGNHEYCYTSSHKSGLDHSLSEDATHGFMPSWGNMGDDSGGECGVPTAKRFTMPQKDDSNGVFWYSFVQGSVHTTVLSAEHDASKGSPQYEWMVKDVSSVNRTVTPWLVVEVHRPMYQSEKDRWDQNNVGIGMRYEFEDVLYDYKVDLYLAGHYHSYLRTCDGLYRSKCDNGGPMHITVGSAGAALDTPGLYWNRWTERYIKGNYGYGRVTIANASALHFEFVKAGAANDTSAGETMDDVWIMRDR